MRFVFFIVCLCLQVCTSLTGKAQTGSLSKSKLEEDIHYLVKTIENVHPHPYHSISREKFYSIRDSIVHSFSDNMTTIDAWKGFAFLMASLNEGHSDMKFPDEARAALDSGKILLFPVLISQVTKEGFLVSADLSPDSSLHRGDILFAINGISSAQIADRLCSTIGGLRSWRELQARNDFAMQLFMHGIRPPYTVTYRQNEMVATKAVAALTKQQLITTLTALRKNSVSPPTVPYRFSRIDSNVGYLDFRTMATAYEPFVKFLADTFAGIKQNPVNGLIIDLRRNGGGNSMLGYQLLTYFTDKPFRMSAGTKWKASEEYKQKNIAALKQRADKEQYVRKYLSLENGEILSSEQKPD